MTKSISKMLHSAFEGEGGGSGRKRGVSGPMCELVEHCPDCPTRDGRTTPRPRHPGTQDPHPEDAPPTGGREGGNINGL